MSVPLSSDVIVVGAGVAGCSVARELARRGLRCQILDDRPVAGGATQASAGILAPYIEAHEAGPLLDLCVRSLSLYDDWMAGIVAESHHDVEFRRTGTLEIALDPAHASELQAIASHSRSPQTIWYGPSDARAVEPALGQNHGALFVPAHGYVAAEPLTLALAAAAAAHGALFAGARVTRLERRGSRWYAATTGAAYEADTVVVAAGSWSGDLKIEGETHAGVRPVRGQLVRLGWQGPVVSRILWGPECYIVPRIDGTLLVGATVEDVGFDERATAAGVRDLLDAASELLPAAWGAQFLDVRVGLRPATRDELPLVGPGRTAGLFYATGHYRNGILLAPLTARLLGDLIVDGRRDAAFDVVDPRREL